MSVEADLDQTTLLVVELLRVCAGSLLSCAQPELAVDRGWRISGPIHSDPRIASGDSVVLATLDTL